MRRCAFVWCASTMAFSGGPAIAGTVFVDQPHDFVSALSSEQETAVPSSRTADDFTIDRHTAIFGFTAEMVISFPNAPDRFRYELYADGINGPGDFILSGQMGVRSDHGDWNGNANLHLVELFASVSINLHKGTYWFSVFALGNGSGEDRAFWGTSGNGQINGSEGYFMSEHFGVPEWTPVSDPRALGFASDFAFTIEGIIPAPGALAVFAVAMMGAKRRRRIR